eukprot:Tamp_18905.p1 GENE.Tamp_18905~~Tamp_18905.p1  ORF type:complete len:377 (-),score=76.31 Tamp_18905:161-1198(-)
MPLQAAVPLRPACRRQRGNGVRMQQSALQSATPEERMATLQITLPTPAPAAANYVPYVVTGNCVYIAGQIPMRDGQIVHKGRVPSQASPEEAYQSARLCGLNIIAQLKAACNGDLSKVKRIVKLVGFVHSDAEFYEQPAAINGASDLMVEVFGEIGRHARSAVGTNTLPFGVTTEVEAVVEVEVTSAFGPGFDNRGLATALKPGMKVEAIDRTFKDIITVATVKAIEGDLVLIGFDGWGEEYDYWAAVDDGDFQPPGTAMRAQARLSPPNGYVGFFDWASYLDETSSDPAPPTVFKSKTVFPSYKGDAGIKFELWHRVEAQVIPLPPSPEQMEREKGKGSGVSNK